MIGARFPRLVMAADGRGRLFGAWAWYARFARRSPTERRHAIRMRQGRVGRLPPQWRLVTSQTLVAAELPAEPGPY